MQLTKRELAIFLACNIFSILIGIALTAGFTDTYRIDTPAGNDSPREADDRMREAKAATQERLNVDHYWTASASNTYDGADTGEHRFVTIHEPNTIAAVDESKGVIHTKDVSGIAELFYINENEQDVQITTAGYLNAAASNAMLLTGNQTAAGIKTFSSAPVFSAGFSVGADTDIGNYALTAKSFTSDIATGTAPLTVTSTTVVTNLNADTVDGQHAGAAIGARVATNSVGGALAAAAVYKAECDGEVLMVHHANAGVDDLGYNDASNPPTRLVASYHNPSLSDQWGGFAFTVRKDEYVKLTCSAGAGDFVMYWRPFATGGLVLQ